MRLLLTGALALTLAACSADTAGDQPGDQSLREAAQQRLEVSIGEPGDATEAELQAISTLVIAYIPGNEVPIDQVFTEDAVYDTGVRGVWEGRDQIAEKIAQSRGSWWIPEVGGFTRMGDTLLFNWILSSPSDSHTQGLEARFEDGLISSLDASSAIPYCLEGFQSARRCRDFTTGEVLAYEEYEELPQCGEGVHGPCVRSNP